jgi:cytochrome bd-type quinol oxidase subunit 2
MEWQTCRCFTLATIYPLFALSAIISEGSQYLQKEVLMEPIWIAISIIALVAIVVLLIMARGRQYQQPSNLAIVGISLVVLGIIFGDDRLIGYSLIGVGVLLSVMEAIRNRR